MVKSAMKAGVSVCVCVFGGGGGGGGGGVGGVVGGGGGGGGGGGMQWLNIELQVT